MEHDGNPGEQQEFWRSLFKGKVIPFFDPLDKEK
jgi:hypothetical protein